MRQHQKEVPDAHSNIEKVFGVLSLFLEVWIAQCEWLQNISLATASQEHGLVDSITQIHRLDI
jgi:hypothetical protein